MTVSSVKANTALSARRREPVSNATLLTCISIGIFLTMYIVAIITLKGGFAKPQQVFDILNNNAHLIIIACALTIVMINGSIDISVAGVVALVSMVTVMFLKGRLWPVEGMSDGVRVALAACIAVGIGLLFGLVQGTLIAYLDIQPFIVTLAGMFFARGMITIVSSEPLQLTVNTEPGIMEIVQHRIPMMFLGSPNKKGVIIPARMEVGVIVALLVVLIIAIMLRKTRLGRHFYAVGGNRQSALTLGINVKKTRFKAHLISSLLAGIAGFVFMMHNVSGNATNATAGEMDAIASSIIGGTLLSGGVGNVIGTFFGVMILATIKLIVVASGLREPWWQTITTGAMLCFFILLQSIVLSQRGRGKMGLPSWLKLKKE